MKTKFTATLLAALLIISLTVLPAAAGNTFKSGDTIKVTLSYTDNPGIIVVSGSFIYDENIFDFEGMNYFVKGDGQYIFTDDVSFTATMKIKKNAPDGKYTIAFHSDECGNKFIDVSPEFETLTIEVKGKNAVVSADAPVPKYEIRGDVNGDGIVKANDARLILRFLCGGASITPEASDYADVNGDGKIDLLDARQILRIAADLV